MTVSKEITVLAEGFSFTECPRWHDGRLWFVDMHLHQVLAVDEQGSVEKIIDVPGPPGGIGWLPDGRLLIVMMDDRKILRLEESGLVLHADLSDVASTKLNDLWVDSSGRTYVGETGFDAHDYLETPAIVEAKSTGRWDGLEGPATGRIFKVEPDGSFREVADGLRFTNGIVIDEAAGKLFVAESFGYCLSRFDLAPDGSLTNRKQLPLGFVPDGIDLDASGCVWTTDLFNCAVQRVDAQGVFLDRVVTTQLCLACAVGGSDETTLFLCTSPIIDPEQALRQRGSRIEAIPVPAISDR